MIYPTWTRKSFYNELQYPNRHWKYKVHQLMFRFTKLLTFSAWNSNTVENALGLMGTIYVSTFSCVRYMWINEGSLPFSWQANGKSLSISIPANSMSKLCFSGVLEILYTKSLVNTNLVNTNFTNTHFQKVPIPHLTRTMKQKFLH